VTPLIFSGLPFAITGGPALGTLVATTLLLKQALENIASASGTLLFSSVAFRNLLLPRIIG
jgi:hypothetical protein